MNQHPEQAYLNLLQEILDSGVKNVDEGTGAVSYSVFGRQIRFDLSQGFPLLTTKKVYWKGVLHELYWFLSGQNNIKYLVDNNVHIWDDYPYKMYVEKFGSLSPNGSGNMSKEEFIAKIAEDESFAAEHGVLKNIYGDMWRHWPTRHGEEIDQLQWVIDELTADPDARNCIVNSWNPEYLYAMARKEDASRFPICHNMYQVSLKGGKLHLQLYQRSADMFLGVPFNIASYALLLQVLAKILGVEPGEYIHTFGDAHIYENHLEQAREQLTREPMPFPTVSIADDVASLDTFDTSKVTLENYQSHSTIKGDLTVAGGVKERDLEDMN
ncbi:thymidylate synthase [Candidatus Nomurabacteria bacterium]|nr:thymidylate synthase [Candidatus Nomurabacteria bacterium]